MKLSQQQKRRMYSHYDHDLDFEDEFWPVMGVLFTIVGVWTGFIHLVDWLTFNVIPWWVEPFTIAPIIVLIVMKERFDSLNPLAKQEMLKFIEEQLINDLINQLIIEVNLIDL